jgi:two-component system sensor histidine kinase VicK
MANSIDEGVGQMKAMHPGDSRSWGLVGAAVVVLLIAIGIVGAVGVVENDEVKDTAERAIAFDVAIEDAGDDLQVAVLDLRHYHRNIAFGGPSATAVADFDAAYATLLAEIDELEQIGVGEIDIPQPDHLRGLASRYYDDFRSKIVLFTSDPVGFRDASDLGLDRIEELAGATEAIDDAGEQMTGQSLARVESASERERVVLILLLSGVALVGVALAAAAGRVVNRLRAANIQEHESSRRLAAALRSKSDFIADASHELRTPLTLIRGNAEIGLALPADDEQKQVLSEILRESTRMGRLVEDLLLLAQSDAGTIPMEREYVPVRWLLDRIGPSAEVMARHHDRCLALELEGEGHLNVDPQRI